MYIDSGLNNIYNLKLSIDFSTIHIRTYSNLS